MPTLPPKPVIPKMEPAPKQGTPMTTPTQPPRKVQRTASQTTASRTPASRTPAPRAATGGAPLTPSQYAEFEECLVLAVVSAGLPFQFVANPHVQRAFRTLNPWIQLPTEERLRSALMDACVAVEDIAMLNGIRGKGAPEFSTYAVFYVC